MAVSRKPKREEAKTPANKASVDESKINEVIERGGSVPNEQVSTLYEDEQKSVQLRLYKSMIDEIDEVRNQTRKGKKPSRHAWILEAIEEKLQR